MLPRVTSTGLEGGLVFGEDGVNYSECALQVLLYNVWETERHTQRERERETETIRNKG